MKLAKAYKNHAGKWHALDETFNHAFSACGWPLGTNYNDDVLLQDVPAQDRCRHPACRKRIEAGLGKADENGDG